MSWCWNRKLVLSGNNFDLGRACTGKGWQGETGRVHSRFAIAASEYATAARDKAGVYQSTTSKRTKSRALAEDLDSNPNVYYERHQEVDPNGSVVRIYANIGIFVVDPAPNLQLVSSWGLRRKKETYGSITKDPITLLVAE